MAGKTISQMTSAGALDGDELFEVVQSGGSKKVSLASIKNWILQFISGVTFTSSWKFNTGTSASDPGDKKFKLNNVIPSSVTQIYINDKSNQSIDMGNFLSSLSSGDLIYIQKGDDSGENLLVSLSGSPTDNVGWWTIPVNSLQDNGVFENNKEYGFVIHFI